MWTEITRPKYERKGLGYSSDLSDPEWAMIEPRLPQRNRLGRPPKTELRRVVNALLYMVRTGCQWRQLPREFPPYTTVQHYFYAWRDSGVLERINFELLLQAREAAGREPSPSAGVIDSTARLANALDQQGGRVEARAVSRGRAQYEPRIIKHDPRE